MNAAVTSARKPWWILAVAIFMGFMIPVGLMSALFAFLAIGAPGATPLSMLTMLAVAGASLLLPIIGFAGGLLFFSLKQYTIAKYVVLVPFAVFALTFLFMGGIEGLMGFVQLPIYYVLGLFGF